MGSFVGSVLVRASAKASTVGVGHSGYWDYLDTRGEEPAELLEDSGLLRGKDFKLGNGSAFRNGDIPCGKCRELPDVIRTTVRLVNETNGIGLNETILAESGTARFDISLEALGKLNDYTKVNKTIGEGDFRETVRRVLLGDFGMGTLEGIVFSGDKVNGIADLEDFRHTARGYFLDFDG